MRKNSYAEFPFFLLLEVGFVLLMGFAARGSMYASTIAVRVSDWTTYRARLVYDLDDLTISAVLSDTAGLRSIRGSAAVDAGPFVLSVGSVRLHGLFAELENPAEGGARSVATVTRTRVRNDYTFDPALLVGLAVRRPFAGGELFMWGAGTPEGADRYGVGFSGDGPARIEVISMFAPTTPVDRIDAWYAGTPTFPGGSQMHTAARVSVETRADRRSARPVLFAGSVGAFFSSGTRDSSGYAARLAGVAETRIADGELWLGIRSPLYRSPAGRTGPNAVASARLVGFPRLRFSPSVAVERRVWYPDVYGSGDRDDLRARLAIVAGGPDDRDLGLSGSVAMERREDLTKDHDVEARRELKTRLRVKRVIITGETLTVDRPAGVRTTKYVLSSAIRSPGLSVELSARLERGAVVTYGGRARLEVTRPAHAAFLSISTRNPVRIDDPVPLRTIDEARRALGFEFGFSGR